MLPINRHFAVLAAVFSWFLCFVGIASAQTLIFSDDLSTGAGWMYSHAGGSAKPSAGDTSEADFGFNYSVLGIPEAPSSDGGDTATSGLRLATNITGAFGGDAVAAVYEDPAFTGQYTVQVDMWLNWAANDGSGIGTTEHGGLYAGFKVDDAQNSFAPGQNGAGLTMATDGDCGNCSYILNKDAAELDMFSGQYSVSDFGFGNQPGYDESDFNEDPEMGDLINLPEFFPEFDVGAATGNVQASGTQKAGAAGFRWITVTAEVDTNAAGNGSNGSVGTAKFSIKNSETGESIVIGTVDNSIDDDPNDGIDTGEEPINMEGGIGLNWIDFFGGPPNPAEYGFGLYDNVRVYDGHFTGTAPEDADGDGDIDGQDFLKLQRENPSLISDWETAYPAGSLAAVSSVPEPATALLLAFGTVILAARRS